MKKTLLTAFALTVAGIALPAAVAAGNPIVREETQVSDDEEYGSLFYTAPVSAGYDEATPVMLKDGEEVIAMTMEDYLVGAVAAEMPASFNDEALKAQAVALRTYALYKMEVEPASHTDADVCSDITCCAAWKSDDCLRDGWGDDFDAYMEKIRNAVSATDGVYIAYDGMPALAVFHSSSDGATEESAAVWSSSLPYLVSVKSPENEENVPNFVSETVISAEDFKATVLSEYPEAVFSQDPREWITGAQYSESGRLVNVSVGGVTVSGTQFRALFGLRSTALTFETDESAVTLTSRGYGHGVGMSQYGANILAGEGCSYQEILERYYPGTELVTKCA